MKKKFLRISGILLALALVMSMFTFSTFAVDYSDYYEGYYSSYAYNCHSILNVTDYCRARIQYNNPSRLIYAWMEVSGTYSGVPAYFGAQDSLNYSDAQVTLFYTNSNYRFLYADYAYKINGISIYSVYLSD